MMAPDYRRPGTTGEQLDERREPTSDTPPAVKAVKRWADILTPGRTVLAALVAIVTTLVAAGVCARTRPSIDYVHEAVAKEARINIQLHADQNARNEKTTETLATMCGDLKAMREMLAETRADMKELRGHLLSAPRPARQP
jgi:cell division protein FtsX